MRGLIKKAERNPLQEGGDRGLVLLTTNFSLGNERRPRWKREEGTGKMEAWEAKNQRMRERVFGGKRGQEPAQERRPKKPDRS